MNRPGWFFLRALLMPRNLGLLKRQTPHIYVYCERNLGLDGHSSSDRFCMSHIRIEQFASSCVRLCEARKFLFQHITRYGGTTLGASVRLAQGSAAFWISHVSINCLTVVLTPLSFSEKKNHVCFAKENKRTSF